VSPEADADRPKRERGDGQAENKRVAVTAIASAR